MDEAAFARLSVDDPILHIAWYQVFVYAISWEYPEQLQPETRAALADLRRRGDTVTPTMLKLMREHQDSDIEASFLAAYSLGTITVAPYLDYARTALRERTLTLKYGVALTAVGLLLDKGSKEDRELVQWYARARPYMTRSIEEMIWGNDAKHGIKRPYPGTPAAKALQAATPSRVPEPLPTSSAPTANVTGGNSALRRAHSWPLWVGVSIGLLVIAWLAFRKRF